MAMIPWTVRDCLVRISSRTLLLRLPQSTECVVLKKEEGDVGKERGGRGLDLNR